jgi:DNA-binding NtrC family response regulator
MILFIEDRENICSIYAHILKEAGYPLKYATNGKKALELLKHHCFEIVICDYYLPDTNGIKLLKKIKQEVDNIYSILFTASSSNEIEINALYSGVNEFISKPCNKERLLISIKRGLEIRMERIRKILLEKKILELSKLTTEKYLSANE